MFSVVILSPTWLAGVSLGGFIAETAIAPLKASASVSATMSTLMMFFFIVVFVARGPNPGYPFVYYKREDAVLKI